MSVLTISKLPARFNGIIMPLLLSIFMTCIVSCISTFKRLGSERFQIAVWLSAWALLADCISKFIDCSTYCKKTHCVIG